MGMSTATRPPTVLVTGVGDTVGQALIKAARQSAVPCRTIGTDVSEQSVGLQWVDVPFVVPHASDARAYVDEVRRIRSGEGVSLILPGSETELQVLSEAAPLLRHETGAVVVASPPDVLHVGMNKWETCRFLERSGLNYPRYARLHHPPEIQQLVDTVGFPLIAKPVRGTGARGVAMVTSSQELERLRALGGDVVVQEYLVPADAEYSVEVYTLKSGRQAGAMCYRRQQLIAGDTYRARVEPHPAAEAEARAVVAALCASGPCNVQLRVTDRGPVTFEINPRFSGGVSLRAHFGYNEVEMALQDLTREEDVAEPTLRRGFALRFWEELYLDD